MRARAAEPGRRPRTLWITAFLASACASSPAPLPAVRGEAPWEPAPAARAPYAAAPQEYVPHAAQWSPPEEPRWADGQLLLQGFIGAALMDDVDTVGGTVPAIEGSGEGVSQFPWIGGGMQWKLGGESVDLGLEGMFGFGWRGDGTAAAFGSSGAVIVVDVDLLLVDVYGGPFVSVFLGDSARVYAAGGPVMEWVDYQLDGPEGEGLDSDSTGFGTGGYARAGIEFLVSPDTLLGLGVRWSDTTVDLGAALGDLEVRGYQVTLTVTQGL